MAENLVFNRTDIEIEGERFNTALFFGILTGLNRCKQLIIREPKVGKTTLAEFVVSIIYLLPVGVIWGSEVSGHPE